ncbi:cell division protein FtsZ [Bifidobacterium catulorum]|uniref:Cell division protein FtsZ n=1 Tax=Bifidobacterium catulorum TaxID=1630173 RepID=A0A2U2MSA5_9BIFI|nr:cell division protein FtsZ [Bifidobacterium catulorum]PWG59722.1 cell division protein FtsZ [Bifidobacterium catulorum]
MSDIAEADNFNNKTLIKVVGVGGAGGNAVNRMIAEGLQNVQFVAINTDATDLLRSDADVKISLSDNTNRGLGAGADPEKGAKAAQDHQSDIEEALKGADMVFVTCGEGGGTGTGASPLVARCARQLGALTVAVVTRPFSFEGPRRSSSADTGIQNLSKEVDALIVIPNDRLLDLSDRSISIIDAFKTADSALLAGVQGITDLITMVNPYIHVDFADVTSVLKDSGTALFGIGSARGEDRANQAAEIAISSPLLESSIEGAHGVLLNIAGPMNLSLQEANEAAELVREAVHPEAQIIWGLALDDAYGDEVRVTVIAAGFDAKKDVKSSYRPVERNATHERTEVAMPEVPELRLEDMNTRPAAAPEQQPTAPAPQQAAPQAAPDRTNEQPVVNPHTTFPDSGFDDLDIPDFLR